MFLPFEVRLLTFLHSSTRNTIEGFVGCLFWALGITERIRFSTVGFSVIVEFSICSAGLTLFIEVSLSSRRKIDGRAYLWSFVFCVQKLLLKCFSQVKALSVLKGGATFT
jgi:hypothetical protein